MDNQRLLIWAFFGVMVWMTYQAWVQDYGPKPEAVSPTEVEAPDAPPQEGTPPDVDGLPQLVVEEQDLPTTARPAAEAQAPDSAPLDAPVIHVTTDVFDIEINTRGGTLQRAVLPRYPVAKDRPDEPVQLLSASATDIGLIRSGVRSLNGRASADSAAQFEVPRLSYALGSTDEIVVPLTWSDDTGVTVRKEFRFRRGSYRIDLEQTLANGSSAEWRGDGFVQIVRRFAEQERSMFDVDSYSFAGPIIFNGESSEKLDRDDLLEDGPAQYTTTNGWLAAIQHHFLSAAVPEADKAHIFHIKLAKDMATQSVIATTVSVAPGDEHTFRQTLFVGPKLQAQLEEIHPRLKLTVDYGFLTILSQPLFWLLSKAYALFANWGVAIISVTILIKLVFYKLTESSGRSMAKMRNLQPRIKALQERYKEDRQQLSQAMMDLYKREKVNPAAGCLPILIQMPFFLAFYWVLLESVEMRQAPFALWITDLSSRDPYFILPVIMGASMFLQQKLNPQVGDPVQVKVMQIMPIIFTAFFAFFPSGLVLYWVTNTVLSIAQQWKINKVVEAESKQKKGGKKKKEKAKD